MINLLEKYKNVIEEIKNNSYVDSLFLFGSYSTNTQKPTSDLDITVIFKPNTTENQKTSILAHGTDELDISDFEELPLILQYKVLAKGKVIKNEEKQKKLLNSIKHQLIDFLPLKNRILKNKGLPTINLEKEMI